MKTIIVICAASLLMGCAHYSDRDSHRGSSSPQSNIQTGASDEDYFPYRSGPGLPGTDRAFPRRSGTGGLGRPE